MSSPPSDCIFCKIVRREAPASLVHEDATTLAFLDIRPITPGHALVIPKRHGAYLEDLPAGEAGPILETGRKVAAAMRHGAVRCDAVSLYVANGREAGQEVPHVHLHVIPRSRGDGFGLRVPPDFGRTAGREELDLVAAKLRAAISGQ